MRTVKRIERDGEGNVLVDEEIPALVHAETTRRGGYQVAHGSRTHRDAFVAICKAHGAKFWPGNKTWEVPGDKRDAILKSLKEDGFQVYELGVGVV